MAIVKAPPPGYGIDGLPLNPWRFAKKPDRPRPSGRTYRHIVVNRDHAGSLNYSWRLYEWYTDSAWHPVAEGPGIGLGGYTTLPSGAIASRVTADTRAIPELVVKVPRDRRSFDDYMEK